MTEENGPTKPKPPEQTDLPLQKFAPPSPAWSPLDRVGRGPHVPEPRPWPTPGGRDTFIDIGDV